MHLMSVQKVNNIFDFLIKKNILKIGIKKMKNLNTTLNIETNEIEENFFNEFLEIKEDFKDLCGNEIIDTREICELVEKIDEVITNINEYNELNLTEDDEINEIGLCQDFIDSLFNEVDEFKLNELELKELEYIDDFQHGATLYLKRDFDIIQYINDMGFEIPSFLEYCIDEEKLMDSMDFREVSYFGVDYICNQ